MRTVRKQVFDEMDRKGMIEIASHYDPAVSMAENEALIAKFNEMRVGWEIDLKVKMEAVLAAE